MAGSEVEERIGDMEARFSRQISDLDGRIKELSAKVESGDMAATAWWKRILGIYADDPAFDEAEHLGREYRYSLDHIDTDASK